MQTIEKNIETPYANIAYEEYGSSNHQPLILLHGFPYSPRAFDKIIPLLVKKKYFVIVPSLRGFGKTKVKTDGGIKSGQQAALGIDLINLIENLKLKNVITIGFDWGRRSSCTASVIRPDLFLFQTLIGGYDIQNIESSHIPTNPEKEAGMWHTYYFNTRRGENSILQQREALCAYLWKLWNHDQFLEQDYFAENAKYWNNSDFAEVVIHSYRHRLGNAIGDARLSNYEAQLVGSPVVKVPTLVLNPGAENAVRENAEEAVAHFSGPFAHHVIPDSGHNLPWQQPHALLQHFDSFAEMLTVQGKPYATV